MVVEFGERGFSLLEALVCVALLAGTGVAVAGAVAGGAHAQAIALGRERLRTDASNVLDELRASTAYDAATLERLAGNTTSSTLELPERNGPERRLTITLHVAPRTSAAGFAVAGAGYDATVTVSDGAGASVTETRRLGYEAPPPGSWLDDKGLPQRGWNGSLVR